MRTEKGFSSVLALVLVAAILTEFAAFMSISPANSNVVTSSSPDSAKVPTADDGGGAGLQSQMQENYSSLNGAPTQDNINSDEGAPTPLGNDLNDVCEGSGASVPPASGGCSQNIPFYMNFEESEFEPDASENQGISGGYGIVDVSSNVITGGNDLDEYPLMNSVVNGLVSRPPIYINGNDNFTPANGVVGGSGTQSDPYIIENWAINAENADGIWIEDTTAYFVVRNCLVENGPSEWTGHNGIYLQNAQNGRIENNTCRWNKAGISFYYSHNNTVTNNTIRNCTMCGIWLVASNYNTLTNNACLNTEYGIWLRGSSYNNLTNNNTCDDLFGIQLEENSCKNILDNNMCSNNDYGIRLSYSSNNTLTNNTCSYNERNGLYLMTSHNNTLTNNTCSYNGIGWGLSGINIVWESENNHIYHNNLVNNATQAYDGGSNFWDNGYPLGGNYWSDYTGVDENHGENQNIPGSDGIGDTPYIIPGGSNRDRYPLMNPWSRSPHAPIYICGNGNFTPANGVNGGGSGTENDPYIIENWAINASTYYGIWVRGTTAYFVVRNCLVWNGGSSYDGIYLDNVTNGKIENCVLFNNFNGIILSHASNNTISNNKCSNNSDSGIHVYYSSPYNTLTNNSCSNNNYGIRLTGTDWHGQGKTYSNTLTNNTCSNNFVYGIYLSGSYSNTLTNNTCLNNSDSGIQISNLPSYSNTLEYNTCSYNGRRGISLDQSYNNTLSNNTCTYNSSSDGITLRSSSNNTIRNNTCSNNGWDGIHLYDFSYNNVMDNNTCENNYYSGIYSDRDNNILTNNTCSNNRDGIYIALASNNTISNNTCSNNSNRGIYLTSSSNNTIHHNRLLNNGTNAFDAGTNSWDNGYPSGGNYWSDYKGFDGNGDGIGDTPYYIPGGSNRDRYPLMNP
jgi:parallel beta-helix repeat protein